VCDLRGNLATRPVDGVCHCLQVSQDLSTKPNLISQGSARFFYREIGHGAHPHATLGKGAMVLKHSLRWHASLRHILVGRRFNKSVAQGHGTDL
jgi:hypothetical protein